MHAVNIYNTQYRNSYSKGNNSCSLPHILSFSANGHLARGKSAPDLNGADNSSDNESKLADGCNNGDSVDGLYIKRTEPHKYELSGFNFIAISDKFIFKGK
jgi:hypothetical protein